MACEIAPAVAPPFVHDQTRRAAGVCASEPRVISPSIHLPWHMVCCCRIFVRRVQLWAATPLVLSLPDCGPFAAQFSRHVLDSLMPPSVPFSANFHLLVVSLCTRLPSGALRFSALSSGRARANGHRPCGKRFFAVASQGTTVRPLATGPRCCRRHTVRWVTELPRGCFSVGTASAATSSPSHLSQIFVLTLFSGPTDQQCTYGLVLLLPTSSSSSSSWCLYLAVGAIELAFGFAAPRRCISMCG